MGYMHAYGSLKWMRPFDGTFHACGVIRDGWGVRVQGNRQLAEVKIPIRMGYMHA
jgi:hypothetical protein